MQSSFMSYGLQMRLFQSQPKEAYIIGEGADDDVSHCMLLGFESYGYQMRLFCSLGWKTLTSLGMLHVTMLVTACYRALSLTDRK